jgi:hypothetical protein
MARDSGNPLEGPHCEVTFKYPQGSVKERTRKGVVLAPTKTRIYKYVEIRENQVTEEMILYPSRVSTLG